MNKMQHFSYKRNMYYPISLCMLNVLCFSRQVLPAWLGLRVLHRQPCVKLENRAHQQ